MALTQMGAGEKYSFRQFDTITDLYTGGLSASTLLVTKYDLEIMLGRCNTVLPNMSLSSLR